jgi:hypothetical protein
MYLARSCRIACVTQRQYKITVPYPIDIFMAVPMTSDPREPYRMRKHASWYFTCRCGFLPFDIKIGFGASMATRRSNVSRPSLAIVTVNLWCFLDLMFVLPELMPELTIRRL